MSSPGRNTPRPSPAGKGRLRALAGRELEDYAGTAAALVLAGRLGKTYPDPYLCADYCRALAPSLRGSPEASIELDLASGLPSLKQIVDVWADWQSAPEFLAEVDARRGAGRELTPELEAKAAYYLRLRALPLRAPTGVAVALRRIDAGRGSAFYEVVFDRFDAAERVFVRHTLLLEQFEWGGAGPIIGREGDYSRQTSELRDKIEKYAGDDSEIAFLLMGKVPGVRVEEVIRGRVGPLWSPWAPGPAGWCDGGYALHLPSDRASIHLERDRDDDPFSGIYRAALSAESRGVVEEEARRLGYRVHKDRKFSCRREDAAALRGRLGEAGTRNLIYTA